MRQEIQETTGRKHYKVPDNRQLSFYNFDANGDLTGGTIGWYDAGDIKKQLFLNNRKLYLGMMVSLGSRIL